MRIRRFGFVSLLFLLGCSATKLTDGGGQTIAQVQAEPVVGGKPRVAVGVVLDRTGGQLERELQNINATRADAQTIKSIGVTSGVRDMLTTAMFSTGQFIVVERDALNLAFSEQEFSQSRKVGDQTRITSGQLEGADMLLLCALTGFDPATKGRALPIPLPFGRRGDFGLLNVSAKRGYAAMDMRIIEVRTGRVVASTAVEGHNWKVGVDLTGYVSVIGEGIKLPGMLSYFSNTPIEQALQKMVQAAVGEFKIAAPGPLQ